MFTQKKYVKKIFFFLVHFCAFFSILHAFSCNKSKKDTVKIGIVNIAPSLEPVYISFKAELEDCGYNEGVNVTYVYDGAARGMKDIKPMVKNLISNDVNFIVTFGNQASLVTTQLTKDTDVPVLLAVSSKPVELGMVQSLHRPGVNVTGIDLSGFIVKAFDWFIRCKPDIKRIYVPHNPQDKSSIGMLTALKKESDAKNITLVIQNVVNNKEMEQAVLNIPDTVEAVFILSCELVIRYTSDLITESHKKKIPVGSSNTTALESGSLIVLGLDYDNTGKQAAKIAMKIIEGHDPKEIPFENAKFWLGINLKSAKLLHMTIPDAVLKSADKIIR